MLEWTEENIPGGFSAPTQTTLDEGGWSREGGRAFKLATGGRRVSTNHVEAQSLHNTESHSRDEVNAHFCARPARTLVRGRCTYKPVAEVSFHTVDIKPRHTNVASAPDLELLIIEFQ